MPEPSKTHLVLIPSYNPGPKMAATVQAALDQWAPVWVVIDGSTDHSEHRLAEMAARQPNLRIWVLPQNRGKGAAVLFGMREAQAVGYTHVLTMDADGQHPAESIPAFMQTSRASPASMVLGRPVFDASAPGLRVKGRQDVELVGQPRDPVGRDPRLVVRLSRVPYRPADRHHAPAALDAALRFRCRSRGAAVLARRQTAQPAGAGTLLPRGRRRRFAFPLLARQRCS